MTDFVPRFLLGLPEPEPVIATAVVHDPLHVRWYRLASRVPMGDRQPGYGAVPALSFEQGDVRVTTLTVRAKEAWIREDRENLDRPATCAILRDRAVALVDEAEGYRAAGRNPARGPGQRVELKAHIEYVRSAKARLGL
jgi:hypothetical protein